MVALSLSARWRSPWSLGAVLTLGVTLLALGGCAGSGSGNVATATLPGFGAAVTDSVAEMPAAMPMPTSPAAGGGFDTGFVAGESGFDYGARPESASSEANREIIVTGFAELRADDPVATSSQVAAWVESIGGNVASRREWRATNFSPGGANLSLRVPAGQLNSVIDALNGFGEVSSITVDQWDVTAQAVDLDARITALQTSVTRLTELLATAGDTGDLLQVERELSNRQADLDALRASRADLTGRVQMSQLEINIVPTESAVRDAEPSPGFVGGLERGWAAFLAFGRGLAVVLGTILPWLLAAGVITALLTPLVRALRRRAASRRGGRTEGVATSSGIRPTRSLNPYGSGSGLVDESDSVPIFTDVDD